MGLLDLMLGQTAPGEQGVEGQSYALPKESHDFAYPVAIRRTEVDALGDLLERASDHPYLDDDPEELQQALDDVLADHDVDAAELTAQEQAARAAVESTLETWAEQVSREVGVVYARSETHSRLLSFVERCKRRDEDGDDAFELPESFPDAAAFLVRLEEATDRQYRAVVHTDVLPPDATA